MPDLSAAACRDSHTKILYRSLQCFLIEFWENQEVCEASTDSWSVQALQRLPVAPGDSQCIHLRGSGGGRVCIVQAVLGSQLINNNQVSYELLWMLVLGLTKD
jgi:hypothetical protein